MPCLMADELGHVGLLSGGACCSISPVHVTIGVGSFVKMYFVVAGLIFVGEYR